MWDGGTWLLLAWLQAGNAKIYITINITLEHMSEIVLQVPDDVLLALKMFSGRIRKGAEVGSHRKVL
jgi:hypothetical protein